MSDTMRGAGSRQWGRWLAVLVAVVVGLAGTQLLPSPSAGANGNRATAGLIDGAGDPAGVVTFTQVRGGVVRVEAQVTGLAAFHGFHIHAGPACRNGSGTPDFALALGHYQGSGVHQHADHGQHAGDMPSLEARTDGGAVLSFETDRITVDEIVGRTVIVHQLADNFANIPTRYGAPDAATLGTGDAGGRRYCGEIGRGRAG